MKQGDVCGRYQVGQWLGAGPRGSVFAGTRANDGLRVALKSMRSLRSTVAGDGAADALDAQRSFARACANASTLSSDHAARVFDVPSTESPFAVMELLSGPQVSTLLAEHGALSIADATRYGAEACDALAEAHALGFIHGNLHLLNWFVVDGSIKLTDFGTSRSLLTGRALGSAGDRPHYEAPERFLSPRGEDPRSDVWSVGVALYMMLTGEYPHRGDTTREFCSAIAYARYVPLCDRLPTAPRALADVIDSCLGVDPESRYQTARDLAHALRAFAHATSHDCATETPMALSTSRFVSTAPVAMDSFQAPLGHAPGEAQKSGRARAAMTFAFGAAALIALGAGITRAASVAHFASPMRANAASMLVSPGPASETLPREGARALPAAPSACTAVAIPEVASAARAINPAAAAKRDATKHASRARSRALAEATPVITSTTSTTSTSAVPDVGY